MHTVLTIVAFAVIFSLLILVHEWGHFMAARKNGVKVEEFGLGLPPMMKKLWKDKKGTIYSLNWIPVGGFVRMKGEESMKQSKDKDSFAAKSTWQKIQIVLAGVMMNFVLAWGLLTLGFAVGMEPVILPHEVRGAVEEGKVKIEHKITGVEEGSLAESSGLKVGDKILRINGEEILMGSEIEEIAEKNKGGEVVYEVLREGEVVEERVNLNEEGKAGLTMIANFEITKVQHPVYYAPVAALTETGRLSVETVKFAGDFFGRLITRVEIKEGVGGPVKIAEMTHQLVGIGDLMVLIQFTALLSISLGVINLMPVPALDGGRFLFLLVELLAGRKLNHKVEIFVHRVGFVLLLAVIFAVTYRDIVSLIPGR